MYNKRDTKSAMYDSSTWEERKTCIRFFTISHIPRCWCHRTQTYTILTLYIIFTHSSAHEAIARVTPSDSPYLTIPLAMAKYRSLGSIKINVYRNFYLNSPCSSTLLNIANKSSNKDYIDLKDSSVSIEDLNTPPQSELNSTLFCLLLQTIACSPGLDKPF